MVLRRIGVLGVAVLTLFMWLLGTAGAGAQSLFMWLLGTAGAGAQSLYGADNLSADFNGDGRREYITLCAYWTNNLRRYQICVTDGQGNPLWKSAQNAPEAQFTESAVACLLLDVDGDSQPELVFSGTGSLTNRHNGSNAVYKWQDGQFVYSHNFWLARSPEDTSMFLMTQNPEQDGEVLSLDGGNQVRVTLGNLHRDVDDELYGDILINGNLLGHDWGEFTGEGYGCSHKCQYVGPLKLKLGKSFLRAVARVYKDSQGEYIHTTIGGNKYPMFSMASGVQEDTLTALSQQMNRTLKADLNHDGCQEIVRFTRYYPCTRHEARYQIVVTSGEKCIWSSPQKRIKKPTGRSWSSPLRLLKVGDGGVTLCPGEHTFLADIDGDGHTELVIDKSDKYGCFVEVWRWNQGRFNFVRLGSLVRRSPSSTVYCWVRRVDSSKGNGFFGLDFCAQDLRQHKIAAVKRNNYDFLYNLFLKNGVVCGNVGHPDCGDTAPVRTKIVPGGLQLLEKRLTSREKQERELRNAGLLF